MRYLTKEWVRHFKRIQIIFKAKPVSDFSENIDFKELYNKQKELFLKREKASFKRFELYLLAS